MRIFVLGSGAREHALVWKLAHSKRVSAIISAPGNPGIGSIAKNYSIPLTDFKSLAQLAKQEKIDITIVGPDAPLADGIVDFFEANHLTIFGPHRDAAKLESSKSFAKLFMVNSGIRTADYQHFTNYDHALNYLQSCAYPIVLKADGLALGKGVMIAENFDDAKEYLHRLMIRRVFGNSGKQVVIEEKLTGRECSLHGLIDGKNYLLFPPAQDYKKVFDHNQGENTGGMGAISTMIVDNNLLISSFKRIFDQFLNGLKDQHIMFSGMLFPGIIITLEGISVLEFNCRFGDPETQVLMRRLNTDLLDLIEATLNQTLDRVVPNWNDRSAVCITLASHGYPGVFQKGKEISGLEESLSNPEIMIFHAGTMMRDGKLYSHGGRVLSITALGDTLEIARKNAYQAAEQIKFEGKHYRLDIGKDII